MSALPVVPVESATCSRAHSQTKVLFRPYGKHNRPNLGLRNDFVCAIGEFLGTGMFLFFALGGTNFVSSSAVTHFLAKSSFRKCDDRVYNILHWYCTGIPSI